MILYLFIIRKILSWSLNSFYILILFFINSYIFSQYLYYTIVFFLIFAGLFNMYIINILKFLLVHISMWPSFHIKLICLSIQSHLHCSAFKMEARISKCLSFACWHNVWAACWISVVVICRKLVWHYLGSFPISSSGITMSSS